MRIFLSFLFCFGLLNNLAYANEAQTITQQLHEFLSHNNDIQQHQDFWADDLIYTSSDGSRFGKQFILDSFNQTSDNPQPETQYSAEEIQVRTFTSTAVLTMKLIATQNGKVIQTYYNSGTFVKRDNRWQAVVWQATKIPKASD